MSQLASSRLEDHPDGTGDITSILNGNWRKLDSWISPSFGKTARQDNGTPGNSGTTVTANAAIFTSDDVGATIEFDDHTTATITVFTSSTVVTVDVTQEVVSQGFVIFRLTETEFTAIARGLCKKVRFVAGDNLKYPRWSNSLGRFDLVTGPGTGITAGRILLGGGAAADPTSSADLAFDDSTDILTLAGYLQSKGVRFTTGTSLTSSTSVAIDMALEEYRSLSLAHDVTFTTSNRASGRVQRLRIICDATPRNLTFPGGWVFLNAAAPASIAASKTAILTLRSYGTADSDIVATWEVQP